MAPHRIIRHPILSPRPGEPTRGVGESTQGVAVIPFTWSGQHLTAKDGETIAAALFAHGIHVFGHHHRDGAPQGIFCANGQCAQCMVIADGHPVKACMTPVRDGMQVEPVEAPPSLPEAPARRPPGRSVPLKEVEALIIGGGPAGLSAADELGQQGVATLLIDDKDRLGGKLVLQTHRFFGSYEAVYAGTRGIDIARRLSDKIHSHPSVTAWLSSTALAVFSDGLVGVLRRNAKAGTGAGAYGLVKPEVLIVATGARERSLVFPGNTLPGIYGAGAFQTLVNRDLIRAADRIFIVGGGNVGLIAGYHAIQAGIEVVGLVEALAHCGGYKVHADKLARLGVPIYTSHTVARANGTDHVRSITIAAVDTGFTAIPGTERSFPCDTILIAVGLSPADEFTQKARAYGMTVYDAGDAQEIAEASAAMFTGRIAGRQAARALGRSSGVPTTWRRTADVLKSHPGAVLRRETPTRRTGVFPVFHCTQEIPCDPCTAVCPQHLISIPGDDIRHLPVFTGVPGGVDCVGCGKCLTICPGLAITLVDARGDQANPTVSVAYELDTQALQPGESVTIVSTEGNVLGESAVTRVRTGKPLDNTAIVQVQVPAAIAPLVAGIRATQPASETGMPVTSAQLSDEAMVCRCERVTAGEIRAWIRRGCRDLNELKTVTRAGMGPCGGKTCTRLIEGIFRDEGILPGEITPLTGRPLFVEAPLGNLASVTPPPTCEPTMACQNQPGRLQAGPATRGHHSVQDVIVIGAGSVGLPTAMSLAQAGLDVLVLDQAPSPGQRSHKAAIGGVRATHSEPAKIRLCKRSLDILSTWQETYGHDIEWTTGGYVFVAYREEEARMLKALLKTQQQLGLNIVWLDGVSLLGVVPGLNPEGLRGGTYSPDDGHCSTLLAGHAIYNEALEAGATFCFGERVTAITSSKGRVTGVQTEVGGSRNRYPAPVVVNATGAWARQVGLMLGEDHPVMPEAHEAGISEPVARFLNPLLVDIRPRPGSANCYFYQLANGQVVFCLTPDPPIPGYDRRETSAFLPRVAQRMTELMPKLRSLRVRRTWRGLYPMTPDGTPLVGWSRATEGYLAAAGMCGQGFMLGPGLGELLARLVTQTSRSESDAEILEALSPYRAFERVEALK